MAKQKKQHTNPLTPIALVGATWVATRVSAVIFERLMGKPAPLKDKAKDDLDPIRSFIWTLGLTGIVALAEVAVTNLLESED